jgi:hypothetical protein
MVSGTAFAAGAGEALDEGPLPLFVELSQLNFLDIAGLVATFMYEFTFEFVSPW